MSMIQATLKLYADCAQLTGRRLPGSAWSVVGLVAAYTALRLLSIALAPFGFAGGFVYGFAHAAAVGWYLALVEISVTGFRAVKPQDLASRFGSHLWEVISVLFLFWIASLFLQALDPLILLGLAVVASIAFNPVPEMVYQERAQSVELLGAAARFMGRNWPEWLAAHVPVVLLLLLLGGGLESLVPTALRVATTFGPMFGFLDAAGAYAHGAGAAGLALDVGAVVRSLAALLLIHAFLVFRGLLYKQLSRSSRRSRAWNARI